VVHGLDHEWIALRPVVAPAGDQADAHGVAPGHQPETVVLDLVNPVGAGRGLAGWGWEAGFDEAPPVKQNRVRFTSWQVSHVMSGSTASRPWTRSVTPLSFGRWRGEVNRASR
jgi:hypothetical protein